LIGIIRFILFADLLSFTAIKNHQLSKAFSWSVA